MNNKNFKIQYDLQTQKILVISTIVSFVILGFSVLGVCLDFQSMAILLLFGLYIGGGVFLVSSLNLIGAVCYLNRLKRHGYVLPVNKKEYDNDLRNVPCSGIQIEGATYNKDSIILAVVHMALFVGLNAWNISFFLRWHNHLQDSNFLTGVFVVLDLGWLIAAIRYFKQGNNEKYRDDVEVHGLLKKRTSIEVGIGACLILLLIVLYVKMAGEDMTRYIYHARQERDQEQLELLQSAVSMSIANSDMSKEYLEEQNSYQQLLNGCYISDWNMPEDEFAQTIAKVLDVTDYREFTEKIKTADGAPRIYVQIMGEHTYIKLENPHYIHRGQEPTYEVGKK
ncbi:MAG: hypothetical protein Q4D51_05815 [Eubacteriales bacterium]|nr:hypothetical protein [Eubacteriales bacterium]